MKKTIFILFFITTNIITSQTKVDELITIELSETLTLLDTVVDGIKVKTYYLNTESESFIIQKTKIDSKNKILSSLPYDKRSLDKYYSEFIDGQNIGLAKAGYKVKNSTEFGLNSLDAYKVSYIDSITQIDNAEFLHLVLEEYYYTFGYLSNIDFDKKNKSDFFNSIKIDLSNSPSQYIGKSTAFKSGQIFGKFIFYGIIVIILIVFLKRSNKK